MLLEFPVTWKLTIWFSNLDGHGHVLAAASPRTSTRQGKGSVIDGGSSTYIRNGLRLRMLKIHSECTLATAGMIVKH